MTSLYVGNLPWDAKDDELKTLFEKYGCTVAAMQRYKDSERSKGFAIVTVGDATKAIADLHDSEFQGRTIIVREDRGPVDKSTFQDKKKKERAPRAKREDVPSETVYVGNLPWSVTSEQLASSFSDHVSANVKFGMDGRSRGYGLVAYKSVEEAQKAIDEMHGTEIEGRKIICRFSRPT
mmetsp:Transcript_32973/g.49804  ORF Transcript_32973/g.49804 Transcript_32973/m.49804 type:complete len:179 (+) Transcript_32973:113-649(+)